MTGGAKSLILIFVGAIVVNLVPGGFWIVCAFAGIWVISKLLKGEGT